MDAPKDYKALTDSEPVRPKTHKFLRATAGDTSVTVEEIGATSQGQRHKRLSRADFAAAHGADPKELEEIAAYARSHGLHVQEPTT
jgi:hypothetical protein